MLVITVSKANAKQRHPVHLGDRHLGTFRTPFFSSARLLIDEFGDPEAVLAMKWYDQDYIALSAPIGVAAKLTVEETDKTGPFFRKFKPHPGKHNDEGSH
jgi:hypothetical protein